MPADILPVGCPPSTSPIALVHRPAKGRRGLACWLALPAEISNDAPPLVAVHGIRRRAREQVRLFADRAAQLGRPIVAPLFDAQVWPRYQQVVRRGRADLALLGLLRELRLLGLWRTRHFDLFGYSGGAQFAHRFAMLYPQLVNRLIVASAGWYTFPEPAPFPYGVAAGPGRTGQWGPRLGAGLDRFLRLPIDVCVGAADTVSDDSTRRGSEIDRQQGGDRVARAHAWHRALREAAAGRGVTSRAALTVLPDAGHDFQDCVRRGGLDKIVLPDREEWPPVSRRPPWAEVETLQTR